MRTTFTLTLAFLLSLTLFAQGDDYKGSFTTTTSANSTILTTWTGEEMVVDFAKNNQLNKVREIEKYAFNGKTNMRIIYLPVSLREIGEEAFSGCTGLLEIVCLATRPPRMSANVFNMLSTKNIILRVPGESVQPYKEAAQWNNFNIQGIIDGTTHKGSFSLEPSDPTAFWGWNGDEKVANFTKNEQLNKITKINDGAFFSDINKANTQIIILPESLREIGDQAFEECEKLEEIICLAKTPPTLGRQIFRKLTPANITLRVPKGSVEAYKAAKQWNECNIKEIKE